MTSPARKLRGEKVPAGQLLDYDFANLAWQDKGNSVLRCWQTMALVRNVCFFLLIIVTLVIAFVYPSNVDGSLKSINSYATAVDQKKIVDLNDFKLHQIMFFDDKTKLYQKLGTTDNDALEKDMCQKFRIVIVEETQTDAYLFVSECMLVLSDTNKMFLYNNFNNF